MGVIIAVMNRKGGIGKTTSTINIGAVMASEKKKVLLIDGDSQRNLTQFFFEGDEDVFEFNEEVQDMDIKDDIPTIFDVLSGDYTWQEAVRHISYTVKRRDPKTHRFQSSEIAFDVIPANRYLDYYDGDDPKALKKAAMEMKQAYDYILIDFPPAYNFLTVTYLAASDYIIVPMHLAKNSSMSGYRDMLTKCREVREMYGNENLKVLGTFYTNVQMHKMDQNMMYDASMEEDMRQAMMFFKTAVRLKYAAVQESEASQKPLIVSDNSSDISKDYKALTKEIMKRIKKEES